MSFLHEEQVPSEEVKSSDDNYINVLDVSNEPMESKSGRKIKPSRRIYENFDDRKKSKSKDNKKSDWKSKSKRTTISATEPVEYEMIVDKTPALEIPAGTAAVCGYCHKGHQDDPLESGKMFSISGVTTHYFCMLFTYNSSQLGADSEGLFGFYGEEVKQQIENGQKKKCKYCSKPGATARCNKKHCGVLMHFPCGQEAGATFQFMGKMHTFCLMHRVKQKVETFPTPPDTDCVICYEKVDQVMEDFKRIRAPCCGRHLHRDCVQRFAMSSGTQHFKCPNCNNQDGITKEFKKNGVYIPYKDAEWELPAQSSFYNFQDMYVQTRRCCVKDCICKEKEGRNFNDVDGEFEIVLCDLCGTNGVHIKCGKIDEDTLEYACVDCGGEVPLEERTFESRNTSAASSTINLSLASIVDESFSFDKENASSSIPSIRDFIKQFEIMPSDSFDSLLVSSDSESSLDSVLCTSEESVRGEKSEEIVPKRPSKKRGPKSKTQVQSSILSEMPDLALAADVQSKHSFFKHTQEMTKMLEDLKKKEQEKKAKDAFFKSLTEAQASEKKEVREVENKETYDFGKYLAKSLGKEETIQVAPIVKSRDQIIEVEEIQRKENEIPSVGIPGLLLENGIFKKMETRPMKMISSIKVRTDLMAVRDVFKSTNIMEMGDIFQSDETSEEQTVVGEDNVSNEFASEGIEISAKKLAFGGFLFTKQKSKVVRKKESSYIEYFYKHMDKSNDTAVKADKQIEENCETVDREDVPSIREHSIEAEINLSGGDENEIINEEDMFDDITLDETNDKEIPEENAANTSNLGLEIVDTFTCSDSFIDELLNSPVKSSDKEAREVFKEGIPQDDLEIADTDAPGTNLIDALPRQASFPIPTKDVSVAPAAKVATNNIQSDADDAVSIKYKPGPRSRTKLSEAEIERTSPTKIKESIAENIKIFEEQAKSLKSKPFDFTYVPARTSENIEAVPIASKKTEDPVEEIEKDTEQKPKDDVEPETTVRYKPGPKSRKKYLLVKEDEVKKDETEKSPKRSLESSDNNSAKKQKTEVNIEDSSDVVNLDSTISSEESSLEVIDLDSSPNETSDLNKLDASTMDIIKEVTDLLEPLKVCKKTFVDNPTKSTVQIETIPDTEAITEINPPTTNPSATASSVSKRASKRPFQCPVCQGFFRSEMVLQQHLAKIHFWNRLLALPKEAPTASGTVFQCSEFPCRYIHKSKTIVAGHLATEHKVVFKIALNIFPDFKLPVLPPTTTDPSITIIDSVPARLPADNQSDHSSKRSLSLTRPEEQYKKPKSIQPVAPVRPIILSTPPHKAVARVKPRTAPVQPTVQPATLQTGDTPLKPYRQQYPALPYPGQEYFYPGHGGHAVPAVHTVHQGPYRFNADTIGL